MDGSTPVARPGRMLRANPSASRGPGPAARRCCSVALRAVRSRLLLRAAGDRKQKFGLARTEPVRLLGVRESGSERSFRGGARLGCRRLRCGRLLLGDCERRRAAAVASAVPVQMSLSAHPALAVARSPKGAPVRGLGPRRVPRQQAAWRPLLDSRVQARLTLRRASSLSLNGRVPRCTALRGRCRKTRRSDSPSGRRTARGCIRSRTRRGGRRCGRDPGQAGRSRDSVRGR